MLGGFFFIAVATIMSLSVAVVWHRFISVDDIPRAVVPVFHAKSMVVYFRQLVPLGLASGLAVDLMFLLVWIFLYLGSTRSGHILPWVVSCLCVNFYGRVFRMINVSVIATIYGLYVEKRLVI